MLPLSLTGKQWTTPSIVASDDPLVCAATIREHRSIGSDVWTWQHPATYPMAAAAADRIRRAAIAGERTGIIGDYDCDGLTSSAILIRLLRRLGIEPIVRIPHRLTDGYGVQRAHIDALHADGVTLLLTTDTGIVATNELADAHAQGIDVIVMDHHAYETLPMAFAILHPSLTSLQSPPAAAGIALAFAHAVHGDTWEDRETDVALAAIGTIADVVPLQHENRTIVREGLRAFGALPADTPLGALRDRCGITRHPSSSDIAFRLAPRLNAAGRLGDATIGLRALLGDRACIEELDTLNARRQELTRRCMDEALASLHSATLPPCIVVASERFPKGIIGLIAGKLTETFGRPAAAVAIEGDSCTASLRSVPGHSIAAALQANAHLFQTFGGHPQAGGCTFARTHLAAVTDALCEEATRSLDIDTLHPVLSIDACISPAHISLSLVTQLATLEPFGNGNPEPIFLVPSVTLSGVRRIGTDHRHLQARMGQIGIIGFGLGHVHDAIQPPMDLACRITENTWNGRTTSQLSLVDIRHAIAQTGASLPSISNTAITGTFKAEAIL